jgi:hypothetical protein
VDSVRSGYDDDGAVVPDEEAHVPEGSEMAARTGVAGWADPENAWRCRWAEINRLVETD